MADILQISDTFESESFQDDFTLLDETDQILGIYHNKDFNRCCVKTVNGFFIYEIIDQFLDINHRKFISLDNIYFRVKNFMKSSIIGYIQKIGQNQSKFICRAQNAILLEKEFYTDIKNFHFVSNYGILIQSNSEIFFMIYQQEKILKLQKIMDNSRVLNLVYCNKKEVCFYVCQQNKNLYFFRTQFQKEIVVQFKQISQKNDLMYMSVSEDEQYVFVVQINNVIKIFNLQDFLTKDIDEINCIKSYKNNQGILKLALLQNITFIKRKSLTQTDFINDYIKIYQLKKNLFLTLKSDFSWVLQYFSYRQDNKPILIPALCCIKNFYHDEIDCYPQFNYEVSYYDEQEDIIHTVKFYFNSIDGKCFELEINLKDNSFCGNIKKEEIKFIKKWFDYDQQKPLLDGLNFFKKSNQIYNKNQNLYLININWKFVIDFDFTNLLLFQSFCLFTKRDL